MPLRLCRILGSEEGQGGIVSRSNRLGPNLFAFVEGYLCARCALPESGYCNMDTSARREDAWGIDMDLSETSSYRQSICLSDHLSVLSIIFLLASINISFQSLK